MTRWCSAMRRFVAINGALEQAGSLRQQAGDIDRLRLEGLTPREGWLETCT
jgi:hypothetical protein